VPLPVYPGPFKTAQAERLLWRAGFGPKKGEAAQLAKLGLARAVQSLTRPGESKLVGPEGRDDKGNPLAPADAYGHDHLWWLDRMVRTTTPLVERMTLIWHDWFATSNDSVGSQKLMLQQNALFRKHALGSFWDLTMSVTKDPAMLIFLSGLDSTLDSPNENYARELMELFTLGADRPGGYTEDDVREQARALTGFTADVDEKTGDYSSFRFDAKLHDNDDKTIFGATGKFDWKDSVRLVLTHPNHPSFFVTKLWSYFIPTAPDAATQAELEKLYISGKYAVAPIVEAILQHPAFYTGPSMVKPPVVYNAGLLRALGRGVDTEAWVYLSGQAGQQLFNPPNVAGWDDERWLDTATFQGRWNIANYALTTTSLDEGQPQKALPKDPVKLTRKALAAAGSPTLDPKTVQLLVAFSVAALGAAASDPDGRTFPAMTFNAIRQLAAVSPAQQTC
jgi:uncharacterized protein (DUF1800 family)